MGLKELLHPPVVSGDEQERHAHVLTIASGMGAAGLSAFILYYGFFDRSYNIVPMVVLLLTVLWCYILNKRGHTNIASHVLVWSMIIGVFSLASLNDGIYDTALQTIPAVLIIATLVLEKRPLIVISVISLLSIIALGLLQAYHIIYIPLGPKTPFTDIFDSVTIYGITVILVLLVSSYLRNSMNREQHKNELLKRSEERYRSLFEQAGDLIMILELAPNTPPVIRDANNMALQALGYSRDELLDKPTSFVDSEVSMEINQARQQAVQARQLGNNENQAPDFGVRHKRKDGSFFDAEVRAQEMMIGGKRLAIVIERDVTERKRAEEALSEREKQLNLAQHLGQTGSWVYNLETDKIWGSAEALKIFGYHPVAGDFLTNDIETCIPERERVHQALVDLLEKGCDYNLEYTINPADGSLPRIIHSIATIENDPQGKTKKVLGFIQDITDRKQAEDERTLLNEHFEKSQNISHIGSWEYNVINGQYWGSDEAKRLYGFNVESDKFTFEEVTNCMVDPEKVNKSLFDAIENNTPLDIIFDIIPRNSAEKRTLHVIASLVKDAHGNPIKITGVTHDITERTKAEEKLSKSEALFRAVVEHNHEGVILMNAERRLVYVSPSYARISGHSPEELRGAYGPEYNHPDDRALTANTFREVIESPDKVLTIAYRLRHKMGHWFWVETTVTNLLHDPNIQAIVLNCRDITERMHAAEKEQHMQQQLQQSQKLESIGTLAGGIAHDFNIILGIITGHLSLLDLVQLNKEKISRHVLAIEKATDRGAALVQQLLTFARKNDALLESVKVNDIIREVSKLFAETFPKDITIETNLDANVPSIIADETQIHQVIMNLCINARDAMPDGGRLSLATKIVSRESMHMPSHSTNARQYVEIVIADTGCGMDDATCQKIFEPFFTTKELGKGTGLGLAVVFGIVEAHKGIISIASEVDKGTTFHIYLPGQEGSETELIISSEGIERGIPGGTETILLVEDEEMLLEIARSVLEARGYTVLSAMDGEEAIEVYKNHYREIHLVVSDFGLPKFNGHVLFKKLAVLNPGVRMVIASGYIEPAVKEALLQEGLIEFVQKPYRPEEISRAIRSALDRV